MTAGDRARQIRIMGFDVDGVFTDGTLYYTAAGDEMKAFSVRDGLGIKLLRDAGIEPVIITGRTSRALELRAQNLGIETLVQGADDKRSSMEELLKRRRLDWRQAGYMGDDLQDLPVMRACGFSATVPEGHRLVLAHAVYATRLAGGNGAVREVCEFILEAQGRLEAAFARFLQ